MTDIEPKFKLFMFRLKCYSYGEVKQDTIISFIFTNSWDRAVVQAQITRLYPECNSFELDDGFDTLNWEKEQFKVT